MGTINKEVVLTKAIYEINNHLESKVSVENCLLQIDLVVQDVLELCGQSLVAHLRGLDLIRLIVGDVVRKYEDVPDDFYSIKSRKGEITQVRQVLMYFLKNYTKYSLKKIGNYCGGRDHSTVIHAQQTIQDLLDTNDKTISLYVSEITRKLKLVF